eukprot:614066-Prymnesium_polylepis.1
MGSIVHACPMGSTFAPDGRAFHARRASHVPPAGTVVHMARRGSRAHHRRRALAYHSLVA